MKHAYMIRVVCPDYGYEDIYGHVAYKTKQLAEKALFKYGPKELKPSKELKHWTMQDQLHDPKANGWYAYYYDEGIKDDEHKHIEYYYIIEINIVDK